MARSDLAEIRDHLCRTHTEAELRRLLADDTELQPLVIQIAWGRSVTDVADDLLHLLERHHLLDRFLAVWGASRPAAPSSVHLRASPAAITWDDLRAIIVQLHADLRASAAPGFDFGYTGIDEKNRLNDISNDYFNHWHHRYEPRFGQVRRFLTDPRNEDVRELYTDLVADLGRRVASFQGQRPGVRFDDVANHLIDDAVVALQRQGRISRDTLELTIAFMYFECDIGRRQ